MIPHPAESSVENLPHRTAETIFRQRGHASHAHHGYVASLIMNLIFRQHDAGGKGAFLVEMSECDRLLSVRFFQFFFSFFLVPGIGECDAFDFSAFQEFIFVH